MKKADHITILDGADGPTSVFFLEKPHDGRRSLKQKWEKYFCDRKKKRVERRIRPGDHSMEEVADYIRDVLGCTELAQTSQAYQEEYRAMRASYMMQYAPELLGDCAAYPRLESRDAEGIQKFQKEIERRQKAAENVPAELFDIDLHILEREDADLSMRWILEGRYRYIGLSAHGAKAGMKQLKKQEKDVWRYYGVTQNDIDQKTERYKELVRALAR